MTTKFVSFIGSALLLGCIALPALPAAAADEAAPKVTVTVADAGSLVVTEEAISLSDADNDGSLTVNDALILTHDKFYPGGAEAGYHTQRSDWGQSITLLWGRDNKGSYGYTVNDVLANSLTDPLTDGDRLYAYCYADAEHYSDVYTFFDRADAGEVSVGDEITLTLNQLTFDASWQAVNQPLADAVITVNGKQTAYKTDADGKVTLPVAETGNLLISAVHADKLIVPPVCKAAASGTVTTTVVTVTSEGITTTVSTVTTDANSTVTTSTTTNSTGTTAAGTTAKVTAPAAKTGDFDAVPALAIAGLLAACTAFMMRHEEDER